MAKYNLRPRDSWMMPPFGSGWQTKYSPFVSNFEEKNLPRALAVIKGASPTNDPFECYDCKQHECVPRFDRELTWIGSTLKRSLTMTCPACHAECGYYV